MMLYSKSIKMTNSAQKNAWLKKRNQHFKSHISHSGTKTASEIRRHHTYSIGYNALLNDVQYMAQLGKLNSPGDMS